MSQDPEARELERAGRLAAEWVRSVGKSLLGFFRTNCVLDFCYTLDGRLGGCISLNTRIWDVAPHALMVPEAGGRISGVAGREPAFGLEPEDMDRSYAVLAAGPRLHAPLLALLAQGRRTPARRAGRAGRGSHGHCA